MLKSLLGISYSVPIILVENIWQKFEYFCWVSCKQGDVLGIFYRVHGIIELQKESVCAHARVWERKFVLSTVISSTFTAMFIFLVLVFRHTRLANQVNFLSKESYGKDMVSSEQNEMDGTLGQDSSLEESVLHELELVMEQVK